MHLRNLGHILKLSYLILYPANQRSGSRKRKGLKSWQPRLCENSRHISPMVHGSSGTLSNIRNLAADPKNRFQTWTNPQYPLSHYGAETLCIALSRKVTNLEMYCNTPSVKVKQPKDDVPIVYTHQVPTWLVSNSTASNYVRQLKGASLKQTTAWMYWRKTIYQATKSWLLQNL